MEAPKTTTLFRPVGEAEMELIRQSGYMEFPPRLPSQPIFYPVLSYQYAARIASEWNTKDETSGHVGYVTRFAVACSFLNHYEVHAVGGGSYQEYWIPAEDLGELNASIAGPIEVVAEFRLEQRG